MTGELSRILTLLRKEKGLSQKQAAAELGISQALLSHYENGARECGLDFLVKVARFYQVSTDYLLGISPDKSGAIIDAQSLPDETVLGKENTGKDLMAVLNKKIIFNSVNVIYDILAKQKSPELINQVSLLLNLDIYKIFRYIYSSNEKNPTSLFSIEEEKFSPLASASHTLCEMRLKNLCAKKELPVLTSDVLSKAYPLLYSSLANLIKNTETKLKNSNFVD